MGNKLLKKLTYLSNTAISRSINNDNSPRKMQIVLILIALLGFSTLSSLPVANAGLFGPNCKKVHPQGITLMNQIAKYYPKMMSEKSTGSYTKAYATYKLLNKKNVQLSSLLASDKNYRCFLDADYENSSYKWQSEYPGRSYGGPVQTMCVLWGVGCKPRSKIYSNPCDEYKLARDYQDCIEDFARPSDPGYVD
ncbi:hypothetical protein MCEMRE203_00150 [Candidatus Nanopelagicaceae bacterium]